jgi:hypothetical protein
LPNTPIGGLPAFADKVRTSKLRVIGSRKSGSMAFGC